MQRVFPVCYNNKDLLISKNGLIFDMYTGEELTKSIRLEVIPKIIASCWIGDIDLPIYFIDGDCNNITRKNIRYIIPKKSIKYIDGNYIISGVTFKKIPGFKYYYISDSGIVYSSFYKKLLHRKVTRLNYIHIALVNEYGVRKMVPIHRLVYYTFSGIPINPECEINHIDGRTWNNDFVNLEEVSALENIRHAMFVIRTRDNNWSPNEIEYICKLLDAGMSIQDVYKTQWISQKISYSGFKELAHHLIHHTKMWKDISSKYSFCKWSSSKITYSDETIEKICEMLEKSIPQTDISKELNVPLKYISSIKTRSARQTISDKYQF